MENSGPTEDNTGGRIFILLYSSGQIIFHTQMISTVKMSFGEYAEKGGRGSGGAVSYTHLTLPTMAVV